MLACSGHPEADRQWFVWMIDSAQFDEIGSPDSSTGRPALGNVLTHSRLKPKQGRCRLPEGRQDIPLSCCTHPVSALQTRLRRLRGYPRRFKLT
jgi:hypothetical protein